MFLRAIPKRCHPLFISASVSFGVQMFLRLRSRDFERLLPIQVLISDYSFPRKDFRLARYEVVRHTNVHLLAWGEFQELFLERWCRRHWVPTVRQRANRMAGYADMPGNDAPLRFHHGEQINPAEAVGLFVQDLWGPPFLEILGQAPGPVAPAIWARRDVYRRFLPEHVAQARTLRNLLNAILDFSDEWLRQQGRDR
jgi:hypothetical protein